MWTRKNLGINRMTNDEKIDGMDAIIEDLIEWELSEYDYEGLKEYFFNTSLVSISGVTV